MMNALKYQYLAVIWSVLVLILCDMPMGATDGVPVFEGFDKLVHTGFFFVLSVFMFYGKIRQHKSYSFRIISVLTVFLISASFGGLIELLQWKVFTYRSADWWDFFCDVVGSAMGVFSYIFLHRTGYEKSA